MPLMVVLMLQLVLCGGVIGSTGPVVKDRPQPVGFRRRSLVAMFLAFASGTYAALRKTARRR